MPQIKVPQTPVKPVNGHSVTHWPVERRVALVADLMAGRTALTAPTLRQLCAIASAFSHWPGERRIAIGLDLVAGRVAVTGVCLEQACEIIKSSGVQLGVESMRRRLAKRDAEPALSPQHIPPQIFDLRLIAQERPPR